MLTVHRIVKKVDQLIWHIKFGDNFVQLEIVEDYAAPLESEQDLIFSFRQPTNTTDSFLVYIDTFQLF